IFNAPDGMADLQTDIPQWIQNAIDDFCEVRQRFSARHNLAGMKEHDVDVALRIQFRAAITADGDQCQRWKLLLSLQGKAAFCRLPQITDQDIENLRACAANFA